jgi:UDP-GlcNAc:undecaprenyl-phosphate GlcNAc-1-phosphate transferase
MNFFFLFLLILILVQTITYKKLGKLINIYDLPDKKRKLHKSKTPVIGGINIFIVILFLIFSDFYLVNNSTLTPNIFFEFNLITSKSEFFALLIVTSLFFVMGLYDDKFSINSNVKLILQIIFCTILLSIDNTIRIEQLNFKINNEIISLGNFSIVFTIFCILVFINAFNMFDGMNLQIGLYSIYLFSFFIFSLGLDYKFIFIIISLIFFLLLNFKGKIFIGNNGSYLMGFLISYMFLKLNFLFPQSFFSADEILLLMLIIGIDLIRVSILRLKKGLNAFHPDNTHIHHILLKKYGYSNSLIILAGIIFFPSFFYFFILNEFLIFIFILVILIYLFLINEKQR